MVLGKFKDKISDVAGDQIAKASEVGKEKFKGVVESSLKEVKSLRPLLNQCGFILGDIMITASIPPSLTLVVEQKMDAAVNVVQVLESEELTKTQKIVLTSIKKIFDLNSTIENFGHTIGQIEVEMSIPPKVTAHLNSKESRSFSS